MLLPSVLALSAARAPAPAVTSEAEALLVLLELVGSLPAGRGAGVAGDHGDPADPSPPPPPMFAPFCSSDASEPNPVDTGVVAGVVGSVYSQ